MNMSKTTTKPIRVTPVAKEMTLNYMAYRAATVPNKRRRANRQACRGLAGRTGE